MNRMDLTPFRRSTVGFDRVFDLMERQARSAGGDNYPPFNIERSRDSALPISISSRSRTCWSSPARSAKS